MTLAINMITRGRAQLLCRTIDAVLENIQNPETVLMVSADDDDIETQAVLSAYRDRIVVSIEPREDSTGAKWNRILKIDADVYTGMADYQVYSTPGFDNLILDAAKVFPDDIGVVYGPLCNLTFPSFQAVTRGLVAKLGWYYPEHFAYWFSDHWLDDIVKIIDRVAFADVEIDSHSRKPLTHELRELKFWTTFYNAGYLERRRQAHAIIDSPDFQEPEWRKSLLKSHHPLIETRSRMLNLGMANSIDDKAALARVGDGGDRYKRIKAKALQTMTPWVVDLNDLWGKAA